MHNFTLQTLIIDSFSRPKEVLKKRNKKTREVWSTRPPRSQSLIQSVEQPAIDSPARPKLSKEGQLYMCSQCPFATEKWMTAFDHIQKKHQFRGKAEEILDKETCNRCGLTSLRVAQGKFHESLHGKKSLLQFCQNPVSNS